jgi:hypothetical protein
MIAVHNHNNNAQLPAHLSVPRGLEMDPRPTMAYYTLDEIERPLPTVEDCQCVDDDKIDVFIGLVSLNSSKKQRLNKQTQKQKQKPLKKGKHRTTKSNKKPKRK